MNRPAEFRSSIYSSIRSEARNDVYPFKYDNDMELDELDHFQLNSDPVPRIGSKIDEVFDAYMEDSLFRVFYPQPLAYSPLVLKLFPNAKKHKRVQLPKGLMSFTFFGPRSNPSSSTTFLQWQKVLYNESLIDAGIYTPADSIIDPENSHRFNRRAVFESAHLFEELASIRAGRMRAFWRYFCHFTIYFVKGVFAGFGMYTTDRFLIPYFNKDL